VICEVAGDLIAARSRQQLERRLARISLPADGTLRMVDPSGEGWGVHLNLSAVSPLVLKKTWTKAELLRLYRDSATGQRHGLLCDEKSVLRRRLDALMLMIVDLVEQGNRSNQRCSGPAAPTAERRR
jgi:hypothetical protein